MHEKDLSEFWGNLVKYKTKYNRKAFRDAIEEAKSWKGPDVLFPDSTPDSTIEDSNTSKKRKTPDETSLDTSPTPDSKRPIEDPKEMTPSKGLLNSTDDFFIKPSSEEINPSDLIDDFVDPYGPTQPYSQEPEESVHQPVNQEHIFASPIISPTKIRKLQADPNNLDEIRTKLNNIESGIKDRFNGLERILEEKISHVQSNITNWLDTWSTNFAKDVELKFNTLESRVNTLFQNISSIETNTINTIKRDRDFGYNFLANTIRDCESFFSNLHQNVELLKRSGFINEST